MIKDTKNRLRLPIFERPAPHDTPIDARDAKTPEPPKFLRPPEGAPNILVILIDDMGFGASSAFGGPCEMPHAEQLMKEGTALNRFHTTALCSPTRQALLTGRNHHTVNMGAIAEIATSMPGYTGMRPADCATIAQVLSMNGYSTGAFGKMHQTPPWETSPSGPFDHWPTSEGFDKFYGFIGGDTDQYYPALVDGLNHIDPPRTPEEGYHLSEDIVDQLINWTTNLHALTPDKPWFAYLAFGATHAPHHAPKEYIERYRGKFDHGYEKQREITFAKQKALGLVPEDAELTTWNEFITEWDKLSADDQMVGTRLFEAYAGMATHADDQVGRVLTALKEQEVLDNTLIFYILGDNGSSAEAGMYGTFNEMAFQNNVLMTTDQIKEHLDKIGSPEAFNHMPAGWAQAMNTPYQWSKVVASHWGGTRTGMIAWMPKRIPAGEIRSQFTHVIDIVPTLLEFAGLPTPDEVNGISQKPLEGMSFAYAFEDKDAEERHRVQYFEIGGNRGIYKDGWTAVTQHLLPWPDLNYKVPNLKDDLWELYAPDDWTQANNVADQYPEKLKELQQQFLIEGSKYNVFPIDDRQRERYNAKIAGRIDLMAGRTTMTLKPGMGRLNENTVLNVKNTSFTVTATFTVGEKPAEGALIAQGGAFGGWCIYCLHGVPAYAHNFVGMETYIIRADKPIGAGKHVLETRFDYDGGGAGKGGNVTLICDGVELGKGRVEKTVPALFSLDEGLDIGEDSLQPVVPDYATPKGKFNGKIEKIVLNIAPESFHDTEMIVRAKYRKQ